MKENRLVDIYSSVFLIALSVTLFIATLNFKQMTASKIGSAFMPQLVAIGLFVFSLILLIQSLIKWKQEKQNGEEEVPEEKIKREPKELNFIVIISLLLMIVYIAVMSTIGFLISTVVYLFVQSWLITPSDERSYTKLIIISVIVPTIIYIVFRNFFHLMLPAGILG